MNFIMFQGVLLLFGYLLGAVKVMKKIIICIGCVGFLIMICVLPVLTTCAFCLGWKAEITFMLSFLSIVQISALSALIESKIDTEG